MELKYFLNILLRRKWLILSATFTSIIVVYIITSNLPDKYVSKAELATGFTDYVVAEDDNTKIAQPYAIQNKFENLINLIRSRPVFNQVSYLLVLHDINAGSPFRMNNKEKDFYPAIGNLLNGYLKNEKAALKDNAYPQELFRNAENIFQKKLLDFEPLNIGVEKERILLDLIKYYGYDYESIASNLKIYRKEGTDHVEIWFASENALLSAFVVNSLCQEFIRYYKSVKGERSENAVIFYAKLLDQKKRELNYKMDSLKRFKDNFGVIDITSQSQSVISQISGLEIAREQETQRSHGLVQAIANIDSRLSGNDKNTWNTQSSIVNEKIFSIKNKINKYNNMYISGGMKNKSLLDSIDILKKNLESQIAYVSSENLSDVNTGSAMQDLINKKINLEIELETVNAILKSISKELTRLQSQVSSYTSKESVISKLEREITVASDAYLDVQTKYQSAQFTAMNLGNSLRQIALGQAAEHPEPTKNIFIVLLGGIGSFSMCVVILFVLEYLDNTIKSPFYFKKFTKLALSGKLNKLKISDLDILLDNQFKNKEVEIFRQQLRKIRFELEGHKPKVILFTSTKPSEGKSFIIAFLAKMMSLNDKRVLIIDTNFKNNGLTMQFKANPLLEKLHDNELPISELVSHTNINNIDLIGNGGSNYSPSELLSANKLNHLIESLSEQYDYIMLEGPNLNNYADTKELAEYADLIVPVFSAKSVIGQEDRTSIAYLKSLKQKLMGGILNLVDPKMTIEN